jgi:hypothetical protein
MDIHNNKGRLRQCDNYDTIFKFVSPFSVPDIATSLTYLLEFHYKQSMPVTFVGDRSLGMSYFASAACDMESSMANEYDVGGAVATFDFSRNDDPFGLEDCTSGNATTTSIKKCMREHIVEWIHLLNYSNNSIVVVVDTSS